MKNRLLIGIFFTLCMACVIAILINCASLAPPSTNIDARQGPVCDRPEFGGSIICAQLRAHGIQNAEDARDAILSANDIALIADFYTIDQLRAILDKWDGILKGGAISYGLYLSGMIKDMGQAGRIANLLERRFGYLLGNKATMIDADIQIFKLLNLRIREATGLT